MDSFWLKIIMMPLIIASVTLAARKWGNVIGGVIAGMPWVGGAILYFIGMEQGEVFMMKAIPGVYVGLIGWLSFCMTYIVMGQRFSAFFSLLSGMLSYMLVGSLFRNYTNSISVVGWFLVMICLCVLSLTNFPVVKRIGKKEPKDICFEIPLRMIMITAFVLTITYFAELLGPNWSGILTPFPVMTATLAVFTHYTQGMYQVRLALVGMYTGVIGFSVFLISIAYFIPTMGVGAGFLIGLAMNVMATLSAKFLFTRFQLV